MLEDANIKLAAVASDMLGTSSRALRDALISGAATAAMMARLARGRLKKIPQPEPVLCGHVTDHHRFLLRL